jgi:hypothetical protein
MAKMTREQMFYDAFGDFIVERLTNIYYEITSLTENKQKNTQVYRVKIPATVVIGTRDVNIDGVHVEEDIHHEQTLPESAYLINEFHNYFDYYYLHVPNEYGHKLSYMLIRPDYILDDDLSYRYILTVVYYKSHKPFPHETKTITSESAALDEIAHLKSTIRMLEDTSHNYQRRMYHLQEALHDERLRRKHILQKAKSKIYMNHMRMEKQIRELIETSNVKRDCPVCFEDIQTTKLVVPACCHYICTDCVSKCHACPLCRETYDTYIHEKYIPSEVY